MILQQGLQDIPFFSLCVVLCCLFLCHQILSLMVGSESNTDPKHQAQPPGNTQPLQIAFTEVTHPMDQSETSHHRVEHTSSTAVKTPSTQLPGCPTATQCTSMQLARRFSGVSLNTTGGLLISQLVGCSSQVSLNTAGRVCY